MEIRKAESRNLEVVTTIVQQTIQQIYPKYYPDGVVCFFSELHQAEHIKKDMEAGCVWVLYVDDQIAGTGTLMKNHITRVFVLPEYQGRGYGSRIMEALEKLAGEKYDSICLDASLPAAGFYAGRGYRTVTHGRVEAGQNQVLVYEIMEKSLRKQELCLRPYRMKDAEYVVSWITDEHSFYQWSADRMNHYPLTAKELNAHYAEFADSDTFWEMTAVDGNGIPRGHLIMRYPEENRKVLRLGFIIVDSALRGKGYGKAMLDLAIRYAFELLHVRKVTLGVFANNPSAFYCYQAAGFRVIEEAACEYKIGKEIWQCIEMELTKDDI